jgi:hypothetical protein
VSAVAATDWSSRNKNEEYPTTGGALDREPGALLLSGGLLLAGLLLEVVAEVLHPSRQDPNDHPAVFAEYARSEAFTAIHLEQFAAIAIGIAGLLVLCRALERRGGAPILTRLGAAAAIAAAAAFAVLQAVDGVALKHAVDAWASASAAQNGPRFATAEAVRWVEWGVNSYFRVLFGGALGLIGAASVRSRLIPRAPGASAILAGLLYIVIGAIVGEVGFDHRQAPLGLAALACFLVFALGTLVSGWRRSSAG